MIFSAVPSFFSFEADSDTDHSVGIGQEKQLHASLCHIDAVWSGMKAEQGENVQQGWFIQTEMEWSSILQSVFTLWDLSIHVKVCSCSLY